jgi:uncharacterized protein
MAVATTHQHGRSGSVGSVLTAAAILSAAGTAGALAAWAAAAYLARKVVSSDAVRPDDVEILGIGDGSVILRATAMTVVRGRYGLWLDGGAGHARLGDLIDHDEQSRTVTRELLGVDRGRLRAGWARWNQYYYAGTPAAALGLEHVDVEVEGDLGAMPAWFVPPSATVQARDTWAILVHGRAATREECLRAVPVLHRLGFPVLVVSYRNDADGVRSPGGCCHLGEVEWRDAEAAVLHAVDRGAHDVVMVGWSMGGSIILQLLSRSWTADRVRGVILDAPVIDWRDVLTHQGATNRVPGAVGRLSQTVLEHPHARRLAGTEVPLSLDRLDWVRRAWELQLPMLIVHSDDDDFVPSGPSRRLAAARPDLVTLVSTRGALHTQEWNVDSETWDAAVARFALDLP